MFDSEISNYDRASRGRPWRVFTGERPDQAPAFSGDPPRDRVAFTYAGDIWTASTKKEGLVMDVRANGGGKVLRMLIERR